MINNKTLRNSHDKSYLAQGTNDVKILPYRKVAVIGINSEPKKNNVNIREPPEIFNWVV